MNQFHSALRSIIPFIIIVFTISLYGDNPIITHKYTADPNMTVFDDRMYIYCSHDLDNQNWYDMIDYTVISSDDLVNWTDHGEVFQIARDASWASKAFAPTCVKRFDKYFLYFPNGEENIGVAIADTPIGPFADPLGGPLVHKKLPNCNVHWCFDPTVFIDDDGQAYMYFGGGGPGNARVIKLGDDMISVQGEAITIDAPKYFEAPFMHKYKGKYYYSYSTNHQAGPFRIDYMISDNPMTGFEYKGKIIENPPDNMRNNNHASIIEYKGNWYFAYHNRKQAILDNHPIKSFQRSSNIDFLYYNDDGTIKEVEPTWESVPQLINLNPFVKIQAETMDNQKGIETATCSEGGICVTHIDKGGWVKYAGVEFKDTVDSFKVRYSCIQENVTLSLRIDSITGQEIGTCTLSSTGDTTSWQTTTCSVSEIFGVHDLFLVYDGDTQNLAHVNWFQFISKHSIPIKQSSKVHFKSKIHVVMNRWNTYVTVSMPTHLSQKSQGIMISLFDMSGKTLVQKQVTGVGPIALPNDLANGSYLLSLHSGSHTWGKKIILISK